MSENKIENKTKGMKFHQFYTYVYLPLSAVLALFVALGRFYYIKTISLDGFRGWIELVHTIYPMVCCVLSVITLPFLIGKTKTGRELVLFSQTFKALLCLVIIASYLAFGNALPALIYTILVFLMALVYGYYRMREWEFDPVTIPLSRREIPVPPKKEALAVSTDDKEEPEAVQEVKDTKEEKAEKEEEILEEEVKPEPVTKEKEIEIKESTTDVSSLEVVKITSIISATFVLNSPIILEEVVIKTRTEDSFVSIKVRNISNKDFVSSTWKMDGTRDFKSNKRISSGSETTIDAIINVPTDRASFSLSSITDEEGNNLDIAERRLTLPEKLDISLLTKDDRFPFFLSSLKKKEGVDAHWLYKEDETSSFWLCPVCGIPVKKEEKCPSCALDREKAQVFSYSSLTTLFDKAKESKEE